MTAVHVRPMTRAEYDLWQSRLAEDYAAEQVSAGRWDAETALQRAQDENSRALPHGVDTPRTLILRGVLADGTPIGHAWVGLDHPRGAPDTAFLYDFEIEPEHRGTGLGRAFLTAVEGAVRDAGTGSLELNVFGTNAPAIALYGSNGYEVITQQMRKRLVE
ncbi:GNAT family N-acetyltransferase [Microbacterium caowuchunii]|uniref:GNAT family N-acetyltransferase n=1 Tax=Microbacterium caowuchunii TaxID=2614638 RepID=A0A5N0TL29_9MICO|nr:GNAT family N-acetyltransferase [Microbacterium caowuchunii]KAA9135138.1 GNAT family N-acetyltransferase [Microbacterium caowuchunii]